MADSNSRKRSSFVKPAETSATRSLNRDGWVSRSSSLVQHARILGRKYFGPLVVALLVWISLFCHLDPSGSYPGMGEGPGLTLDETFNVQQGVILVESLRTYGLGILSPTTIQEVFSPPLHLPDHPPLGRFWLGLHHHFVWWLAPPENPEGPFVTACARAGSASAFSLTILLVGCCATAWYGEWAGLMAALSFALAPRLLGHAHLAALETFTNLTCTAATLAVAGCWPGEKAPSNRTAALTGILLGLALLSKIQGFMLPVPIILWSFARWQRHAIRPLAIWGGVGLLVFFVGWPWLWLNPWEHFWQFLRGASVRAELSLWYFGEKLTDRTAPIKYSPQYFFWSIPFKLHLIAVIAMLAPPVVALRSSDLTNPWFAKRMTSRELLIFWSAIWAVWLFAIPQVPVYDCERLSLTAVPLWLLLVGRGSELMLQRFEAWWPTGRHFLRCIFLSLTLIQIVYVAQISPTYLSYYTGVIGGIRGAATRDLERNYWGDAITRSLLLKLESKLPRESVVAVTPVLHQFQTEEMWRQSPILRRHGIRLRAYTGPEDEARYVLLFQRRADLPSEFLQPNPLWTVLAEVDVDGVQLAALLQRNPAKADQDR